MVSLVPDNIYVKQALEWYIIRQMMMGGYVPRLQLASRTQSGDTTASAGNDMMYPSIDKWNQ